MKTIALVLACVAAVTCNDLHIGSNYGRVIFDQKIQASPAIWRQSQKITINATDNEVINHIVVTDQRPEKDGDAKIIEGGKGEKNVTIELQSPTVFRGFDFHVVIYAVEADLYTTESVLMMNDTDVNQSGKPEDKDVVNVTPKGDISTTVSSYEGKSVEGGDPRAPVATADQNRTYRNTEEQINPIVQNTNTADHPEQGTTKNAPDTTTLNAPKVNGYNHPASIVPENKVHIVKDNKNMPQAFPVDISEGDDAKIEDELPTSTITGDDVTTTANDVTTMPTSSKTVTVSQNN